MYTCVYFGLTIYKTFVSPVDRGCQSMGREPHSAHDDLLCSPRPTPKVFVKKLEGY